MVDPTWEETTEVPPTFEETVEAPLEGPAWPAEKRVVFGEEAARRAMEEELAERNWWEKLEAGLGTSLDLASRRLKQAIVGLTPEDEEIIRRQRQIAATGPGMAGQVVGTSLMLGPTAGLLMRLRQAAKAIPSALPRIGARAALPPAVGAATLAATQPTLPGESEAEQAVLGAIGGGAGAVVGKGVQALFAPTGKKVTEETVRRLTEALERDGLDPVDVLSRAGEMSRRTGKPVTLADVIGDDIAAVETRHVLREALAEAPGPARAELLKGVEQRAVGQQARVLEDVSETLGTSRVPRSEAFEELARTKREAAAPLYEEAFRNPAPILDEKLNKLWERPSMGQALKEVIKDQLERGEPIHTTPWAGVGSPPRTLLSGKEFKPGVPEVYTPTIQMLDRVKQKLYDIEQGAFRTSEVTGKPVPTQTSQAITTTRRDLTKLLDEELAPIEYRQARKMWGDYSDMESAFKRGTDVFKHDPSVIRRIIKDASPAERDAFASGIYAHFSELTSKEGLDWAGNNLLRDTRKMSQLRAAFGEGKEAEEAFKRFVQRLKVESQTMQSLRIYPPTRRAMHAAGMSPGEVAETAARAARFKYGPLLTLIALARRATGRGGGMTPEVAEMTARLGFTPMRELTRLGMPALKQLAAPPVTVGPLSLPQAAARVSAGPLGLWGRAVREAGREAVTTPALPPLTALRMRTETE